MCHKFLLGHLNTVHYKSSPRSFCMVKLFQHCEIHANLKKLLDFIKRSAAVYSTYATIDVVVL